MKFTGRKRALILRFLAPLAVLVIAAAGQDIPENPNGPALNLHRWGAVTIFNGLPSDNVRAIAQTSDGAIWFGTDNGLARFDGRRVQIVPLEAASRVLCLRTAPDGSLWIGTENGAFRLSAGYATPVASARGYAITAILTDPIVHLGTDRGVVLRVGNDGSVESVPAEPLLNADGKPLKINGLSQIGEEIGMATEGRGLVLLSGGSIKESGAPFLVNVAVDVGTAVIEGLGVGRRDNGFLYRPRSGPPRRIDVPTGSVTALESDGDGGFWTATDRNGLFFVGPDFAWDRWTVESTAGGLRSDTVNTVFIDREGVLWLGTDRGACRFDPSSPIALKFSDIANSNFVRTMRPEADGSMTVATNYGVFRVNGQSTVELPPFKGRAVYALARDAKGELLFAGPAGVSDRSGRERIRGDARALALFRGSVWAATFDRGLVSDGGQVFPIDSPSALFADSDRLWIGTVRDGLFVFDGNTIAPAAGFDELRGTVIRKIINGAAGDRWFACENGLYRLRNGQITRFLADTVVRDVVFDDRDIWAATVGKGLVHIREDAVFGTLVARHGVEHGIPSEQVFAVVAESGRIFAGTNRGYAEFEPRDLTPAVAVARVLSQRLHDAREVGGEIALEFPQNSLLIEATGISSRTFPEQFQYSFTLRDSNGAEIERRLSSDPQFSPSNLGAGNYLVEIRAISHGLNVSEPVTVRFSVARAPFPWTAAWLAALLTVALVALVWALIERRRLSQRNRELATAKFNLATEAERERSRIARDLHDQTLADLRNLMMMSDRLPGDTKELRAEIESVSTEIRRICEDLSPSLLENVGLSAALEFLLRGANRKFKFTAEPEIDDRCGFDPASQMQIFRIAQEVVSNIVQHSPADAIEMSMQIADGEFELAIRENGIAYDPDDGRKDGRGIANIRARAGIIDARVEWERVAGENVFRLTKPLTVEIHDGPP